MRPSRIVILVLAAIAGILLIYSYLRPRVPLPAGGTNLPLDLQTVIPASWKVVPGQYKTCDFDGDGENEYLVIYSYDVGAAGRGLIGGVIYDLQVNRPPQAPGVEAPYRPAFMTPYRLLPDMYGGKGQGYLGQSSVLVTLFPPVADPAKCRADEIVVFGYSYDPLPTTLSIFRWAGEALGYVGWYVQGNVRLATFDVEGKSSTGKESNSKAIVSVRAYNQLNQRSLLCAVRSYRRTPPADKNSLPPGLDFAEIQAEYTIDFCYGAPKDPAYPEGVVVALLQGQNPPEGTPTGASYLTAEAQATLPAALSFLKEPKRDKYPVRILSVSTPGSLGWYPPQGTRFTWTPPGTPAATPQTWWMGNDAPAPVETEIVTSDGVTRLVRWTLVSFSNEKANADLHWRITRVELP
ncbi:MAG: hypothetical protein WHX53_01740 [Anaerolineae bacterium]